MTSDAISRRRALQAGIAASIAGFAGCAGTPADDGGGGTTTTTGGDQTQYIDPVFNVGGGRWRPADHHWNRFNPKNSAAQNGEQRELMFDWLFYYNHHTGEYLPVLAESLTKDGPTVTLKLKDNRTWRPSGDPVTVRDIAVQLRIGKYLEFPLWKTVNRLNIVDDYTLEFETGDPVNVELFRRELNRLFMTKEDGWHADFLTRFEDAADDQELDAVKEDLLNAEWKKGQDAVELRSYGPAYITEITQKRWILEPYDDFPIKTNIKEWDLEYVSSGEKQEQMRIQGLQDAGGGNASQEIRDLWPEWFKRVWVPGFGGRTPAFNLDHEIFGRVEFRQGVMYLVNREPMTENTNPRHRAVKQTSGMPDEQARAWLGDKYSAFENYGFNSNPDKATERFQQAGLTKENGQWVDGDGEQVSIEWVGPPWTGPLPIARTMKSQMEDFGFDFEIKTVNASQWQEIRRAGNFEFTGSAILGGPHPFFYFRDALTPVRNERNDFLFEEFELPPIGDQEGPKETVNLQETFDEMRLAETKEEAVPLVQTMAWFFNYYLPHQQMTQAITTNAINTKDWKFPGEIQEDGQPTHEAMAYRDVAWQTNLLRIPEPGTDNMSWLQPKKQGE